MNRELYKILSYLVILIVGMSVIGAWFLDVPKFCSLVLNSVVSQGTVVSKEKENHMSVWFEYKVAGRTFRAAGRAGDIDRTFETIQIGESVPVYYDATNQESATMGDPNKYLRSSIRGTAFIFFSLIVVSLLYLVKQFYRSRV